MKKFNLQHIYVIKKSHLYIACLFLSLFSACKKGGNTATTNNPVNPVNPKAGVTTGNTTDYNGYVVKTLGISRILVGVDANMKLTVVQLYGGGNKVVIKPGTGNTVETVSYNDYATLPDAFGVPDGMLPRIDKPIDNSTMLDTVGGAATVIKIRGFDKSKTGYNQLNLVMCKFVYAISNNSSTDLAGQKTNLTYLKFTVPSGKKASDYGMPFFKQLFAGNIAVSSVEMAATQNPYVVEDQIASFAQLSYTAAGVVASVDFLSLKYRTLFGTTSDINVGDPLKLEWVNANSGTVTKIGKYVAEAHFDNMKVGGADMLVEPSDSLNRPFLRISGFNPAITGFNQLRLFIAKDDFYDGSLQAIYSSPITETPSLNTIKSYFLAPKLKCYRVAPQWYHY